MHLPDAFEIIFFLIKQKAEQKAVCRQWQNHSNLIFRLSGGWVQFCGCSAMVKANYSGRYLWMLPCSCSPYLFLSSSLLLFLSSCLPFPKWFWKGQEMVEINKYKGRVEAGGGNVVNRQDHPSSSVLQREHCFQGSKGSVTWGTWPSVPCRHGLEWFCHCVHQRVHRRPGSFVAPENTSEGVGQQEWLGQLQVLSQLHET